MKYGLEEKLLNPKLFSVFHRTSLVCREQKIVSAEQMLETVFNNDELHLKDKINTKLNESWKMVL